MENASIAKALNYLMEKKKVTATELAEGTGISKATVSKLRVKDTNQIDLDILQRLAKFFDVGLEIFCGYEEYSAPEKLTEDEKKALMAMRHLNRSGMEHVMEYASILSRVDEFSSGK